LFGVWAAAYYDWWFRLTVKHPVFWAFGIGIAQFPLMWLLWSMPPVLAVVSYAVLATLLVPAFLAASRNSHEQAEKKKREWEQTKYIQKLINLGKKRR
jgi:hypothetical protein